MVRPWLMLVQSLYYYYYYYYYVYCVYSVRRW